MFNRGFLICPEETYHNLAPILYKDCNENDYPLVERFVNTIKNWGVNRIFDQGNGDRSFVYVIDPINPYSCSTVGTCTVILIGICIDLVDFSMDLDKITKKLSNCLNDSVDKFLKATDLLNGRYCLIYSSDGETIKIQNDACGTRSIYYDLNSPICASHYEIIRLIRHYSTSLTFDRYCSVNKRRLAENKHTVWCMPGNLTPYDGIVQLICNHELDLKKSSIKRIWPRSNMSCISFSDAIDKVSSIFIKEVEELSKRYDIFESLTGGNDSRMTLAATKNISKKIHYFTYVSSGVYAKGVAADDERYSCEIAQRICEGENLEHHILVMDTPLENEIKEDLSINHYHHHIHLAIPKYNALVSGFLNPIHLRSNLNETVRKNKYIAPKDAIPWKIISQWQEYRQYDDWLEEVEEINKKYYYESSLDAIYDYPLGSIFYVEYRMNQWLGGAVLTATDYSFDTFHLINARVLIECLLAVPDQFRSDNSIVYALIQKMWPELMGYGMPNTPGTLYELFDKDKWGLRSMYTNNDLKVNSNTSDSECKFSYTGFILRFTAPVLKKGDYIEVEYESPVSKDGSYVYIFGCLTRFFERAKYLTCSYYININGKDIESVPTQLFGGRINQICYTFDATEDRVNIVRIGIRCNEDIQSHYINGMFSLKYMTLRREYGYKFGEPTLHSTERELRRYKS